MYRTIDRNQALGVTALDSIEVFEDSPRGSRYSDESKSMMRLLVQGEGGSPDIEVQASVNGESQRDQEGQDQSKPKFSTFPRESPSRSGQRLRYRQMVHAPAHMSPLSVPTMERVFKASPPHTPAVPSVADKLVPPSTLVNPPARPMPSPTQLYVDGARQGNASENEKEKH